MYRPWDVFSVWIALISSMQLDSTYSTNTNNSFRTVFTTKRNFELTREYSHWMVGLCSITPFIPSTYNITCPRAATSKGHYSTILIEIGKTSGWPCATILQLSGQLLWTFVVSQRYGNWISTARIHSAMMVTYLLIYNFDNSGRRRSQLWSSNPVRHSARIRGPGLYLPAKQSKHRCHSTALPFSNTNTKMENRSENYNLLPKNRESSSLLTFTPYAEEIHYTTIYSTKKSSTQSCSYCEILKFVEEL